MLSIQDIVQKTAYQRKQIRETMDSWGMYHPNIQTPEQTNTSITEGLKPADKAAVKEAIRHIPLREFLAKSGTTGIAGAAYLVPDKVHDELIMYSKVTDICPLIGHVATGWRGGALKVDIVSDESYAAHPFASGGQFSTQTVAAMQATIAPKSFGIAPRITGDMIEDANFSLVDYHLQKAALGMGEYASELALTVLKTATDGWGTVNSSATGDADETKLVNGTTSDIGDAVRGVGNDQFIANTLVTTPESWAHSISTQATEVGWSLQQATEGYTAKLGILDVVMSTNKILHDSTDAVGGAFTECVNIIFDRANALLTGRKRWMEIRNYADPVRDLAGSTITARQDSVTLYDDSIYVLTET